IVFPNAADCDSVITLSLSLLSFDTSIVVEDEGLLAVAGGMDYQWLDCANNMAPIPGATTQFFHPEASGQYAVQLSSGDCSYTTSCVSYTGTSITELNERGGIRVHPNPAGNVLYLELAQDLNKATLRLMDISGRVLVSQQNL